MNAEIPKNILLVEDELIIALANSRTLSSLGYEVIIANSGEEAVEITRIKHKIDLVLMDIDLGVGMDGTKAAELILTKRDIPVLFLSSRTDSDTIKKTESITSYGYVVKGSNETVLGASIKMAFKLFDANQTTKEVNRKLKVSINKIKENERRLQLATRLAKLGIWDWNIATDYTVWEGSMYEIYGVSPDEFTHLGTDYLDYVHDDSKEIQKKYIEESFKNAITEDGLLNGEFMKDNPTKLRVIRPNGTEVFILGEAVAVVDNDGIPTRMLGVVIDVTEKTRIENEAKKYIEKFKAIFEQAAVGVAQIDSTTGKFEIINQKYCDIIGYSHSELTAKNFQSITHPDDLEADLENMARLKKGEISTFTMEKRYFHKDGSIVWVSLTVSPIWGKGESPSYHIAVVNDITEKKKNEEKINSLLIEKDLILKEVHHRIKNNILIISSLLSFQKNRLEEPVLIQVLQEAENRLKSMMVLYERLYASSNYEQISVKEYFFDLTNQIMETFPFGKNVELKINIANFDLDSKKLSVLGIILNELLTNSMKYAFLSFSGKPLFAITLFQDDSNIVFEIIDNGNGIPESVEFGKSTGFGFTLVNLLIKQLKGSIELVRDKGTLFRIKFPE